jgi:hypothetical protein
MLVTESDQCWRLGDAGTVMALGCAFPTGVQSMYARQLR